ncbi:hypothetical protein E2562_033756 [Oryza meyeriana var. granulata]|uniref:Uncharacterized protein n=1 Tax=Oryza meyeriana var. granulata TaxID=110450 RepID=A0A6G1F194_9ORYZ|nr:hypothetical protein E2562_033756 [Oryza meyeriana var. granulata]
MKSMHTVGSTLPSIRAAVELARQEVLRRELAECHLVAGIWCHGFKVAQMLSIRANLPQTARLVVAKNSNVAEAVAGTRWEAVRPFAQGMNTWLFVRSDEIPPALRPYRDFQKESKLQLNDFTGTVQSYQYRLGCLQMPAVSVLTALHARHEAMAQPPPAEEPALAPAADK